MKTRTKHLATCVIAAMVLCNMAYFSHAQEYPSRAVDLVVPYAAGGGVDTFFRSIRESLAKELKVPVNIVNRPGGGGVVGSSSVANSRADGYTLLGQEMPSFLMAQVITPSIPYHVINDFIPVASCASIPFVFAVRAESEFKTLDDLVEFAKRNPGKLLGSTAGVGSSTHFELELFNKAAGVKITHLPLGGGGEVIPNLLGGHTDLTPINIGILKPHIRAGKIRVLATASAERIPEYPQVPTTREKGYPEVNINMTLCILGPKGLPPQICDKLAGAVHVAIQSSEAKAILDQHGYKVDYLSSAQMGERLKKDLENYFEIASAAGFAKGKN